MERLINIDNGGTLTDICVNTGTEFSFTKTLTTPQDLSECLFKGIEKASEEIFGDEDLMRLLHETKHIRYSSTQGTNALVERKGPLLGFITDDAAVVDSLRQGDSQGALFHDIVGERVVVLEPSDDTADVESRLVAAVNRLTTVGAQRLVVAVTDHERERFYKSILLHRFPRHLLGSVPILFSWEFTSDTSYVRRVWSALINTFLHPTVERFLYSAEHRLRAHKVKNPLLIYRNDGASSRVAKSVALKTYSSGPRGGLEGTRALARAHGLEHVLMIDIGGTTTDVGQVDGGVITTERRGHVQNIPISYELSDVRSAGVGGSSIFRVVDGEITVGPESVGAAPGPACFGFGGDEATITDVNLLLGVLDPDTYLNGDLTLNPDRSRQVITERIAEPLGVSLEEALVRMEHAYSRAVAEAFLPQVRDAQTTTLAAFGGGGPMSACNAARIAGLERVVIPRLAAVFSAFGISFSNVAYTFEHKVNGFSAAELEEAQQRLKSQAKRSMFQEGHRLKDCVLDWFVVVENADGTEAGRQEWQGRVPDLADGQNALLSLTATFVLPHPQIEGGVPEKRTPAKPGGTRLVRVNATEQQDVPVVVLDEQAPGAELEGPAIVEGPFFTARVPAGWHLVVTRSGDLLLHDRAAAAGTGSETV